MKFSTRSTYGLRALGYLAKNYPKSATLTEIAQSEHISLKYLELIFASLKKAKVVLASKGAGGGYRLAAEPQQITLWQAIWPLEKTLPQSSCSGNAGKHFCQAGCCRVSQVMAELQLAMRQHLEQKTLNDLIS
jgi:Rrf2 family protein